MLTTGRPVHRIEDGMIRRDALVAAAVALVTISAIASGARAQESAPAFEVASVKPNKSGDQRIMFGVQPGGRFTATNTTVQELIRQAYDIQFPGQLEGGPDWIRSERFDVLAKAPEGTADLTRDIVSPMLQSLLADRFMLTIRRERREMATYDLLLARDDGTLGDRITVSTADCAPRGRGPGARGAAPSGPPPGPPAPGSPPSCGMFMGLGRVSAGNVTMAEVARMLSPRMNRIVTDKTGLTGPYQFEIEFTPEQMPNVPPGGLPPGIEPPPSDGPSLFTALQEQLGLKLESSRAQVDVFVIERIERPTED
jgi:uncharacterized protein (TIGR03435 family)